MDYKDFNKNLEARIKALIGQDELVPTLCILLNKGKSSIYKKLRSEVGFSMEEVLKIVKHFKISLDYITHEELQHNITFDLPFKALVIDNASTFLGIIAKELAHIANQENFRVYYITREIPLFYHFYFPELAKFKAYSFMKTAWAFPKNKNQKFSLDSDIFDQQFTAISSQLIENFSRVPSKEFWNFNVLETTLSQIEYFLQSGLFKDPNESLVVIDSLYHLIDDLSEMCNHGKKFDSRKNMEGTGTFELYINELTHTGNVILAKSAQNSSMYITLDNPNYIKSSDLEMCTYIENWMHRLESFSEKLSNSNSRTSMRLFHNLRDKISQTEKRIKVYL